VTGVSGKTAEVTTAGDLAALLTDQLRLVHMLAAGRPKGWQQLTCAPDVAEALAGIIREADEADPRPREFTPPPAFPFPDIPVIISPDSAPGTWRLVTHDRCEVTGEPPDCRVSHADCTITAEGRLE